MDKFLAQFSKNTLAIGAILIGMLFIIFVVRPPTSVCDSQMESIKTSQKLLLFKDTTSKKGQRAKFICYKTEDKKEVEYACSRFESLRDRCKRTNDPGGCYELFSSVRGILMDLDTLTRECSSAGGSVPEIKNAIWDTVNLIVRVAWGTKPPTSYHAKFNWLDTADLSLFCKLKTRVQNTFGESSWTAYREKTMRELPGANELPRNQVWELSIFSENCARYP